MTQYKDMDRNSLINLINQAKDTVSAQRIEVQRCNAALLQANVDLKGSKVMLSMLAQRNGGTIEITDEELADHKFDLRIAYDASVCKTTVRSVVAKNVIMQQDVETWKTDNWK